MDLPADGAPGTVVTVELPAAMKTGAVTPSLGTLLVVDDEPQIHRFLDPGADRRRLTCRCAPNVAMKPSAWPPPAPRMLSCSISAFPDMDGQTGTGKTA